MAKMKIILEEENRPPIVIENAKGILALTREADGIRKCMVGELSTLDLALMIKAIAAGDGRENSKLKKAWMLSVVLSDYADDKIVDMTPKEDGLNDPFAELAGAE